MNPLSKILANATAAQLNLDLVKVLSVDNVSNTCDCQLLKSEQKLFDVKYKVSDSSEGEVKTPKNNTLGIIAYFDKENAYLISCDEYEEYSFKIGELGVTVANGEITTKSNQAEVKVSSTGISITNNGLSLSNVLTELINNILALTVTCTAPGSPSSPPINAPAIAQIILKLKQVLP